MLSTMQELSDSATTRTFQRLQQDLEAVYALNSPESTVSHVVVALPSFSVAVEAHISPRRIPTTGRLRPLGNYPK